MIYLIAQNLIAEKPDLLNIRFMGLVFCHNIKTIHVSNTTNVEQYNLADNGPNGEPKFPCMLKLNMLN